MVKSNINYSMAAATSEGVSLNKKFKNEYSFSRDMSSRSNMGSCISEVTSA